MGAVGQCCLHYVLLRRALSAVRCLWHRCAIFVIAAVRMCGGWPSPIRALGWFHANSYAAQIDTLLIVGLFGLAIADMAVPMPNGLEPWIMLLTSMRLIRPFTIPPILRYGCCLPTKAVHSD